MSAKPYEFQMAVSFPERWVEGADNSSIGFTAWGGHFREDEDDWFGIQLAVINGEDREENG